jgi:hypothetical protein
MAQMSLFSRTEIAGMRDWTAARNHCPERDAFRREHEQHRAWGLRRRHAAKLRHIQDSRSTPPTAPAGRNDQTRPTSPTPPDPHPAGTLPANCDLTGYGYPNPTSTSTSLAGSGPAGGSLAGSGPAGGSLAGSGPAGGSLAGCGSPAATPQVRFPSGNPAGAVPQRQPRGTRLGLSRVLAPVHELRPRGAHHLPPAPRIHHGRRYQTPGRHHSNSPSTGAGHPRPGAAVGTTFTNTLVTWGGGHGDTRAPSDAAGLRGTHHAVVRVDKPNKRSCSRAIPAGSPYPVNSDGRSRIQGKGMPIVHRVARIVCRSCDPQNAFRYRHARVLGSACPGIGSTSGCCSR